MELIKNVVSSIDVVLIPIRQWLVNFDETPDAYDLNEMQKCVDPRNKVSGTAKWFLETVAVYNIVLNMNMNYET